MKRRCCELPTRRWSRCSASGEGNGTAYMAMRLYKGETLRQVLAKERKTSPRNESPQVMGPIRCAEMLHREQVFHRDIAPDNIIMLADGRSVPLDFGSGAQDYR